MIKIFVRFVMRSKKKRGRVKQTLRAFLKLYSIGKIGLYLFNNFPSGVIAHR